MSQFEINKFYRHEMGRTIAILGTVKTFAWGEQFVIEETDPTGQGISCTDLDSDSSGWTEITKDDWLKAMEKEHSCCACGLRIPKGSPYRNMPSYGLIHESCFQVIKKENQNCA